MKVAHFLGLTGIGGLYLDQYSSTLLTDKDKAFVTNSGQNLVFEYSAASTAADQRTVHPYAVRPSDYVTSGVWIEKSANVGGKTQTITIAVTGGSHVLTFVDGALTDYVWTPTP